MKLKQSQQSNSYDQYSHKNIRADITADFAGQ